MQMLFAKNIFDSWGSHYILCANEPYEGDWRQGSGVQAVNEIPCAPEAFYKIPFPCRQDLFCPSNLSFKYCRL